MSQYNLESLENSIVNLTDTLDNLSSNLSELNSSLVDEHENFRFGTIMYELNHTLSSLVKVLEKKN